jgi:hypothetical protein
MRKIGTIASWTCPLILVFVIGCDGCGGPSSMPIVQITPWVPPARGVNPLVLSVKVTVTNLGSYVFLDSSGLMKSVLIVTAKDGSNTIGSIEEKMPVSGWGEGEHKVDLTKAQKDLYENPSAKTVIFEVVAVCQKGTDLPQKARDTESYTKP